MTTNTNQTSSSAKVFVVQFGALLALYTTISFIITLLFSVINIYIPDAVEAGWYYEGYINSLRLGIAGVLVFAPTYLLLSYHSLKTRKQATANEYGTGMRWLLYLSLLVAGAIILGSLVSVIVTFLNGEITGRFILKVLVLLFVLGSAFTYYLLDVRDFWLTNPTYGRMVLIAAATGIVLSVGLGIYVNISPTEAREYRFDQQQIDVLQQVAYSIDSYVEREGAVPEELNNVYRSESFIPQVPEGRPSLEFRRIDETSYELCAEFAHSSAGQAESHYSIPYRYGGSYRDWNHEAGWWCFELNAAQNAEELRDGR